MSASIVHLAELEDVSTHERSTTEPAASEEEARRHAEDVIRQRPNLRLIRIYPASAAIVGEGKITAYAQVIRTSLYDTDLALWAEQQAELLRQRDSTELDWDNVAEEIESLSRSDKREIRSRLAVICEHLLKWQFQPEARSGSWRGSIREARDKIADLIEESPSLTDYPAAHLSGPRGAYARGRAKAVDETGLIGLPEACPWSVEQVLDDKFWPEPPEPRP